MNLLNEFIKRSYKVYKNFFFKLINFFYKNEFRR